MRTGVLAAAGNWILFADADGATPIEEERKLAAALAAGADLAVGSRLVADERVETPQNVGAGGAWAGRLRPWPGGCSHCRYGIPSADSRCFAARAAKRLFKLSQETGYLFDIEILALAQHFGYRMAEVPIRWSEQPGSRMSLRKDAGAIVSGLYRVRRRLKRLPMNHDPAPPR